MRWNSNVRHIQIWKWGRIWEADQCESFCRGTWYIILSLMWILSSLSWWTGFPILKGNAPASHVFHRSFAEKLSPDTWTWNTNWSGRGVDIFTAFCTRCHTSLSLQPATLQITTAAHIESINIINYFYHVKPCISTCGGQGITHMYLYYARDKKENAWRPQWVKEQSKQLPNTPRSELSGVNIKQFHPWSDFTN